MRVQAEWPQAGGSERVSGSRHALMGGIIGLLAGGGAIGAAELVAAAFGAGSSPIIAVGGGAIDATPEWLKSFAIRTFGERDKLVLLAGMGATLVVAAIVLGIASVRRPVLGIAGILAFGALGVAAAVTRPANTPADAIPSLVGAAIGIVVFGYLRRAGGLPAAVARRHPLVRPERQPDSSPRIRGFDRRRFLFASLATVGLAGSSAGLGRLLIRRANATASRAAVRIPIASDAAALSPAGADLEISGVAPFITPNALFYRVDTALFVPAVDAATWSLTVHGMVDREITLDYAQLLSRALIERDITLACVSNEVGGRYIGNARWIGAPLRDLLEESGVQSGATQIVSRSTDGFTVGTPTAEAMDGRDAMLAVAMNGEPLPLEHGFPVRMLVPGLYGYVSATKWVVDLELTTFEAYDVYWIQRGWAQQAPIKTQSRIDTPKPHADLGAGQVAVAGVAWAQHWGIRRVEVWVDEGEWTEAELAAQDTVDTWRQWVYRWDATPGRHTLAVRATDGEGATQTADRAEPFPDGATGHHTIVVDVS